MNVAPDNQHSERQDLSNNRIQSTRRFILSIGIFLIFLRVMYSDSNAKAIPSKSSQSGLVSTGIPSLDAALDEAATQVNHQEFPSMISAVYRGQWDKLDIKPSVKKDPVSVVISSSPSSPPSTLNLLSSSGDITLQFVQEKTIFEEIQTVRGIMRIYDGDKSNIDTAALQFSLKGSYVMPGGLVSVYGNPMEASQITLFWNKTSSSVSRGDVLHFSDNEDSFNDDKQKRSLMNILSTACTIKFDFRVKPLSADDSENRDLDLLGLGFSDNCHDFGALNITASARVIDSTTVAKANNYAIFMAIVGFAQISLTIRQMTFSHTPAGLSKLSMISIWYQSLLDCYLSILHIFGAVIWENVFPAFALCAFINLILSKVFELRYMLMIWQATRSQRLNEDAVLYGRAVRSLYTKFYASLIGGVILVYYLSDYINVLIFILYSFWLPQIFKNVYNDVKKPFDNKYLLGMTLSRTITPSYIYLCPKSWVNDLTDYKGDLTCGIVLNFWLLLQVAILLGQQHFGARFFIPKMFLPQKYNYHRKMHHRNEYNNSNDSQGIIAQGLRILSKVSPLRRLQGGYEAVSPDENENQETVDCVICVCEVSTQDREGYLLTPCDHYFHKDCLEQWMIIKMECPTCRAPLPPT